MSFLAVLGLVAFYEAWGRYRATRDAGGGPAPHWAMLPLLWGIKSLALAAATTLVAGSMSSIPAVYHFGRLSPYSLIANGLAIPVIGIAVMPPALIAAILMPLGLEALPLKVMGLGLRLVVLISDGVAGLPGANVVAQQPSLMSAVALGLGAVCLCLMSGWIRLSGMAIIAAGLAMTLLPRTGPDILIERTGQNVVIRNADGLLVPALPRRARFSVEKWMQVNGEEESLGEAAKRPGWTCADNRCDAAVKGRHVTFVSKLEGKVINCDGIDILIADFPLRGACRSVGLRIDRFDLWRYGAHAVTIGPGGNTVETARGRQGNRPWVVTPRPRSTPYRPAAPKPEPAPA
jgi:competence protein ComEC